MMEWQPIETGPKDGTRFIALNHDREIWPARYTSDGRICFRMSSRVESACFVERELADGTRGMVRDEASTSEAWRSDWTLWARLYEIRPTHWMPLPAPPVSP